MPFFLKMRVNSFEISSSSIGRSSGITSTMVTLVPKRAKIEANSQPTAPAPMTSIDFGTSLMLEDVIGVDDPLAVGLDVRQVFRHGAHGQDDVLRVELLRPSP